MTTKKPPLLIRKLSKKGFTPRHAAEVGVYLPETSNIYNYIISNIRCTLIEPDPRSCELIKKEFGNLSNITLYQVALCDFNGHVDLVQRNASTFLSTLSNSPSIINDDYVVQETDKFTVEARIFSEIDDGSIDLISIDTEGSEWYALKHMLSRPCVISIETHGAAYINPYIEQIQNWMTINGYKPWYRDNTDTVYIKQNSLNITVTEKIMLAIKSIHLLLRRQLKKAKIYIRSLYRK